jgi:ABC-type amino acid transport substrate-binding protein
LRVGITPARPPLIFRVGVEFQGAEADFAFMLGKAFGRPVTFVNLSWENLVPALVQGKIDIIMSGMTVTDARRGFVNFSDPYMKSGLVTLMRVEDRDRFNSVESILRSRSTVGAMGDTPGESFARDSLPNAFDVIPFQNMRDAIYSLENRRIDLFIDDVPSISWGLSGNEGSVTVFWQPLRVDHLAWAVRKEDDALLTRVNLALGDWRRDGTLREILGRWLPTWREFD